MQQFELRSSYYLSFLLILLHGAVLAVLPQIALPFWAGVALTGLVLLSLSYYLLRDAWLRLPVSCVALLCDERGVTLIMRDGAQLACDVLTDSVVSSHLAVLRLFPQGSRRARSVVILPDSLDAESFRQLRVWLKWTRFSPRRD